MKIALVRYHDRGDVNTRLPESLNKIRGTMPPLGIAYIAATLEKSGYEVKIIDAMALNLSANDLRQILLNEKPDIVGVTAMISNIRGALEAARIAKECNAIVVLGGPLLAIYPKEALSYNFLDYGIIGEGEHPMVELVRAIEGGLPTRSIKGLIYKEGGEVHVNEPYIVQELDELPFPSRHLLPMERYSSVISLHPMTTMIASRGCPYRCGFCIKGPSDKRYRTRDPKRVVDEMESVIKTYKVKEIMFYDDTITLDRAFMVGLCDEIIRRGLKIKWESPTRIDRIDLDLLRLMRKAGCIRLRYGVESGDPEILAIMNKEIDLKSVRDVFKWTKESGIETFAYFIIGYIHETPETMLRTIALSKDLNPDLVMFTVATPYPMTPLFEMSAREGYVAPDYWKEFVLGARSERLPYLVPDAERWVRKAYRDFYFRPNYIVKALSKIRSLHDIEKYIQSARGLFRFQMKSEGCN